MLTTQPQAPLDALESDPVRMGWMQGSPPPADKLVRFENTEHFKFPQLRWSFANLRHFVPTSNVARGEGPVSVLPRRERNDLDAVRFTPLGSAAAAPQMSWAQSLLANYTDAIVVLHQGAIVYERYFGVMKPSQPHLCMSVTKSLVGLLAQMLVAEGLLDDSAPVVGHVPELKATAWGDASLRQVMDMTTGIDYGENYADPNAHVWQHLRAGGLFPSPPGYSGAASYRDFLQTLHKAGEHGRAFSYKTVNTDVLAWVLQRCTGQSLGELISQRLWSRLGVEHDAYLHIDREGTEFAGGGFNCTLRDLAHVGEMLRCGGQFNGQQIVSPAVVQDIQRGAKPAQFAPAGYTTLPGWSYRNMWWVSHNEHGAYMARGVHGQGLYVDPLAQMVIARFASHPLAANMHLDPTSLPAYHAVAKQLMG